MAGPTFPKRSLRAKWSGFFRHPVHEVLGELEEDAWNLFETTLDVTSHTVGAAAAALIKRLQDKLQPTRGTPPGDTGIALDQLIAEAFGLAAGSALAAAVASAKEWTGAAGMARLSQYLAALIGFEEIARATLGPDLREAVAVPAGYHAREKFKQTIPGAPEAAHLLARGLLVEDTVDTVIGFHGFNDLFAAAIKKGGFIALSPMVFSRLADNTPLDEQRVREALKFRGHRPQDIDLMVEALERNSIKSLRQAYLTSAIDAAGKGFIDQAHLDQVFQDLNLKPEAADLVRKHVAIMMTDHLMTDFAKSWELKFNQGLIDEHLLASALSGLGFAAPFVDARVAIAAAGRAGKLFREQERSVSARARRLQTIAVRGAVTGFEREDLDRAELAAALLVAGVDPTQVTGLVALAIERAKPRPRRPTTRVAKTPAEIERATKIRAVETQYRKGLISDATLISQLVSLGLTQAEAAAELALLAAARKIFIAVAQGETPG